ncbi:ShlB/FhaC/HecB family hemolysin secretion/activation protein [Stenotrophomonas indicatrix]|uniref:ShlB/FhaC/HecB family hemolysin secretion/activation protein n=1 Tax=Stenotrophomonas indicatrix TaxID=2045451 RepID=UPI00264E621F|nr:ShlB/FhaC/HecB family hemolysin secretion/activation protein [Stenotrophomonas indicatrix]MDN8643343.1 ShlB/FhaC/HecB family hemolysin secretion/activation protein [Stenotrophomonas indicatrix]MDN8654542.1 ShlB/FhaC/HecB family hemolysin secretion/activation protein [Stenotrophomonas indicatrix]
MTPVPCRAVRLPLRLHPLLLALASLPSPAFAQDAAPASTVNINEYIVRGNTVLDARQIERAVEPFLGPGRTLADVEKARDAVNALYQQAGYQSVYVELPEQQVNAGVVLLKVQQTPIGQLRVVGARHDSPERIRERVPSLAEGRVPDFDQAQKELTALNEGGRRQVMPLVREGQVPGTMDVDLQVEEKSPWRASAALNNDHSADTEKLRLSASLAHDNLWRRGHSASIGVFIAPEDTHQAKVFSASYTVPFEGAPWSLEASGYTSDSRVLNAGGQGGAGTGTGTNVIGNGHSIGLKLNYRLPGSSSWWRQLSLGVDFKDTEEDTQMGKDSLKTPLKYAPVTLAFVGVRQGEHDQLSINTQLVAGTRRLFGYGSNATDFGQKRYWADPSFVAFKADVSNTHTFGNDWQWYARGSLQVTDAPLVSAEQFAAGGMYTVRGYLSAEAIGDYGGLANLEWRTPAWSLWSGTDLRLYSFADAAYLRLRQPLPEQRDKYNLASVGLGAQLRLGEHLQLRLDYAWPYADGPVTRKDDPRLHFNISTSY